MCVLFFVLTKQKKTKHTHQRKEKAPPPQKKPKRFLLHTRRTYIPLGPAPEATLARISG